MNGEGVESSGWNVPPQIRPWRTSVGSPLNLPTVSTPSPVRSMRGARMKTISTGLASSPFQDRSPVSTKLSICRP